MSLQQTEQEQLLTHMCEARLPHHMYKTLTMDQLPKANSSNYSTLKIKRHMWYGVCPLWYYKQRQQKNKGIATPSEWKNICPSEDMISRVKRQPGRLKISTRDICTIHIASSTTSRPLKNRMRLGKGTVECMKNGRRSILKWSRGLFVWLIDRFPHPPFFGQSFL